MNGIKFEAFTPKNDVAISSYQERLDVALSQINKDIKNIAVTGSYGSGKSSILRSYFKNNEDKKAHVVSLADFNNSEQKNNDKPEQETVKQFELEKALLQQLVYSLDANKLKYSSIKRVVVPNGWSFLKIITLFFAGIGLAYFIILFEKYKKFNVFIGTQDIPLTILLALFLLLASYIIYRYTKRFHINKVTIGAVSVDGKKQDDKKQDDNPLNTYLDELIYFFRVHKDYNVFVFEDMDRFNDVGINVFIKLRDINKVLNDYLKLNKSLCEENDSERVIKFIYVLRDNTFTDPSDRVKFFDIIISVIPFIGSTYRSFDAFKELIYGEGDDGKNDDALMFHLLYSTASNFINDYRIILAITNDYHLYKERLGLVYKLDKMRLFAVMIYKNYYPSDFEKQYNKEGLLWEIMHQEKKFYINDLLVDKYKYKRIDLIQNILKNAIIDLPNQQISNDINFDLYKLEVLYDQLDIKQYEREIGNFYKNYLNCSLQESIINNLESNIVNLNSSISLTDKTEELFKKYQEKYPYEYKDSDLKLLKNLLINGYIDENYGGFINYACKYTINDIDFIKNVMGGGVPIDELLIEKIDNPDIINENLKNSGYDNRFTNVGDINSMKESQEELERNQEKYSRQYSDSKFQKVLNFAKSVLCNQIIQPALVLYHILKSPDTAIEDKMKIMAGLGYFIFPIDLIPDLIPFCGFSDDLTVLTIILKTCHHYHDNSPEIQKAVKEDMDKLGIT